MATVPQNIYTFQILIDLKLPDDMAVLTLPHPRLFYRPDRQPPNRGTGVVVHELVADDVVRGIQIASEGRTHPSGRAVHADAVHSN